MSIIKADRNESSQGEKAAEAAPPKDVEIATVSSSDDSSLTMMDSVELTLDSHELLQQRDDEDDGDNSWDNQSVAKALKRLQNSSCCQKLAVALTKKKHKRLFFLIKEDIVADMNVDFTEVLVEQIASGHDNNENNKGVDVVEAHLEAANHLLQEFFTAEPLIGAIQDLVFASMEAFLYPRLNALYSDLQNVAAQDSAKLVNWIDEFSNVVSSRACKFELSEKWVSDQELLTTHYLDNRIRAAVKQELVQAVDTQAEEDVREDPGGNVITDLPEQVASIFSKQMQVAQEELPSRLLPQVVRVCNEELANSICDMQLKIVTQWKDMSIVYFCAIINDATHLTEQIQERNKEYNSLQGRHLIKDLAELAMHSTEFLCQHILSGLSKPTSDLLTSVGDRQWEAGEGATVIEQSVATLEAAFADLKVWLISDKQFLKVLKRCFELTIQTYLESFFGNSLLHGIQCPEAVAEELRRDFMRLAMFFTGPSLEGYHEMEGFFSIRDVNDQLWVLQNVAAIIEPSNLPGDLHEDIVAILKRFSSSEDGAAVLHLVGLRKPHQALESLHWVKAIAVAKKARASTESEELVSSTQRLVHNSNRFHGPDLRNSKFIRNIRPSLVDHWCMSERTLWHAEPTLRLLETSGSGCFDKRNRQKLRFGSVTMSARSSSSSDSNRKSARR